MQAGCEAPGGTGDSGLRVSSFGSKTATNELETKKKLTAAQMCGCKGEESWAMQIPESGCTQ